MAEESIGMQELMKSIQNIARDVLKIEEKIHKLNEESIQAEINGNVETSTQIEINRNIEAPAQAEIKRNIEIPIELNEKYKIKEDIQKVQEIEDNIQKKEKPKLIISEITGCVYLPYTQSDIDYYKRCGYDTEEEIVEIFYTVPLKKYSNFSKARVKERIYTNEK